jgi:hypothetical protein
MSLVREKVDHSFLLGEAADRFADAAERHGVKNIHRAADFPAAVALATPWPGRPSASCSRRPAPATTCFNNYEETGVGLQRSRTAA